MCVTRSAAACLVVAASILFAAPAGAVTAVTLVTAGAPAANAAPQDQPERTVLLQYLGHSCFVLTAPGGDRLVIDPFASGEWPGLSLPVLHADRVLVSHPHWDHSAAQEVRGHPKVIDAVGTTKFGGFVVRGFEGRHAPAGGESIGFRNTVFVIACRGDQGRRPH